MVQIIYKGANITAKLEGKLVSFTWHDKTEGEASEINLVIMNPDDRWLNGWLPQKGDKITPTITGINGDGSPGSIPCGTYTVDEIHFEGSGTEGGTITIMALSAGVTDGVRTKTSLGFEGNTLLQIAESIAKKYNLKISGLVANSTLHRVTQFHEGDIEFLHRLSMENGYFFNLRGNTIVFTYVPDMLKATPSTKVKRNMVMQWSIRDKIAGIFVKGQNRFFHNKDKKIYETLVAAGANPSADVLTIRDHVDNEAEGLYKVDGRLYKKNLNQVEVNVTMPGRTDITAGVILSISGWYTYDGNFFVGECTHTIDRSGHQVQATLKKILPNQSTGNPPAQEA